MLHKNASEEEAAHSYLLFFDENMRLLSGYERFGSFRGYWDDLEVCLDMKGAHVFKNKLFCVKLLQGLFRGLVFS